MKNLLLAIFIHEYLKIRKGGEVDENVMIMKRIMITNCILNILKSFWQESADGCSEN